MSKAPAAIEFFPGDGGFNRVNALYLAHAADIAYHRRPVKAARERLGLEVIPFRSKLTRTRGFLGLTDTHAVLAFRGSDPLTLPNWVTDAVVRLVEQDEYAGRVHHGFASVLKRSWTKIEAALDAVGDRPLFLTGHSMGGALAVLTACRLAERARPATAIYTFGSPRVGDPAFCRGYSLPTYRVVNRLDLVPELPLASLRKLLPERAKIRNQRLRKKVGSAVDRIRCYGHVDTLVHIDLDGVVSENPTVATWREHAVERVLATRGKSLLEGATDHMIGNYIKGLEGRGSNKSTRVRRRTNLENDE